MKEAAPEITAKLPEEVLPKLTQKLFDIKDALETKDPKMSQHLRESHFLLNSYPETAHLLDDNEIKLLLDAAQHYTQVKIVEAAAKTSGSRKKVNASDL